VSAATLLHAGDTPAATADLVSVYRSASLTSGRPNLVWRFVIPAVAAAANYGHKTKI
jgi:hypothetical protein